jgi:hypothetical protein
MRSLKSYNRLWSEFDKNMKLAAEIWKSEQILYYIFAEQFWDFMFINYFG